MMIALKETKEYICSDERAMCNNDLGKISRDTCFRCKVKWLDSEVDE